MIGTHFNSLNQSYHNSISDVITPKIHTLLHLVKGIVHPKNILLSFCNVHAVPKYYSFLSVEHKRIFDNALIFITENQNPIQFQVLKIVFK